MGKKKSPKLLAPFKTVVGGGESPKQNKWITEIICRSQVQIKTRLREQNWPWSLSGRGLRSCPCLSQQLRPIGVLPELVYLEEGALRLQKVFCYFRPNMRSPTCKNASVLIKRERERRLLRLHEPDNGNKNTHAGKNPHNNAQSRTY